MSQDYEYLLNNFAAEHGYGERNTPKTKKRQPLWSRQAGSKQVLFPEGKPTRADSVEFTKHQISRRQSIEAEYGSVREPLTDAEVKQATREYVEKEYGRVETRSPEQIIHDDIERRHGRRKLW